MESLSASYTSTKSQKAAGVMVPFASESFLPMFYQIKCNLLNKSLVNNLKIKSSAFLHLRGSCGCFKFKFLG